MQFYKTSLMKKLFLIITILQIYSICYSQKKIVNDTTVVLENDIYNNFKASSQNYGSAITIPFDSLSNNRIKILNYVEITKIADSLFDKKNYSSALRLYIIAFKNNMDKGQVLHRFRTAICYSKLEEVDNSFLQLFRIAEKGNYYNYFEIENETTFAILKKDKQRWQRLISIIKKNALRLEEKYSSEIQDENQ